MSLGVQVTDRRPGSVSILPWRASSRTPGPLETAARDALAGMARDVAVTVIAKQVGG
jgi:hypothetical protein